MACKTGATMFPVAERAMLHSDALKVMGTNRVNLGRTAFITGGGSGLGKAMAEMFSGLGASVAIASRRLDLLQEVSKEISGRTGNKVVPIQLNVKDASAVQLAVDQCEAQLGLPDIVVNNAAGNFIQATERLSPNAFKAVVDIVLNGTFYVTLEIAKRLIKQQKRGTFLSITTPYATTGSPFVVPSAAAKAGVETMSKSLAAEWGKYGLRFNCIAPGPIYTEGAFDRLDPSGQGATLAAERLPAGRLGDTKELANLAAYLCSDYSSWMNGSIINLDGGETRLNSGAFSMYHSVEPEQWGQLEQMIRGKTGKSKM